MRYVYEKKPIAVVDPGEEKPLFLVISSSHDFIRFTSAVIGVFAFQRNYETDVRERDSSSEYHVTLKIESFSRQTVCFGVILLSFTREIRRLGRPV